MHLNYKMEDSNVCGLIYILQWWPAQPQKALPVKEETKLLPISHASLIGRIYGRKVK